MAKSRSPNYPGISLGDALERARLIYDREHRGKMAQEVVAAHLGYNGLNGASLTMISALRKYGLLEGEGRELRISQDGVTILVDRPDSTERQDALRRCALRPVLFAEIAADFDGDVPSEDNLRIYLQKKGFITRAASAAARSFRETMELATQEGGGYSRAHDEEVRGTTAVQVAENKGSIVHGQAPPQTVGIGAGEREVLRHEISPGRTVRVLINGPIQLRDFERLIQLLNLQKGWHQTDTPSAEGEKAAGKSSTAPEESAE
ncbi:MAG TPA: hypothetical protein VN999_14660 [Thermoanaerobaculia bacterium]|nr:hypothetical protein [Thermoanaerobaculia bacterium]